MNKKIRAIILWAIMLLTGCAFPHYFYSPNIQSVPLFKESNEFYGLMAMSTGKGESFELQAGYSLPMHIALNANYMNGKRDKSRGSVDDITKISYFEGSIGYYKSFLTYGIFEIYGGFGHGSQNHTFAYTTSADNGWFSFQVIPDGKADLSFSKLYFQPNMGLKTKWVEAAVSFRLSSLDFDKINIYNTKYHLDELNLLKEYNAPWLFEPSLTLRGGPEMVKFQIQVVSPKNLTDQDLMFEECRFSFGMVFSLSKKKDEK